MRIILHSDLNSCYASIESLYHPEYKKVPLAVGGDPELRHGIILAKNELAKKAGVKTGEAIWQAKLKCPGLKVVNANMELYSRYCKEAREIYKEYTDLVEPFGPDEAWLDITGSSSLFGSGEYVAEEIRERIKKELGLTVSIGVSFNKVFAKFGSDYKKPDAVTVITPLNFRDIVWSANVGDLLYAGPSTVNALNRRAIFTVGDVAAAGYERMKKILGKNGETLYFYAEGLDNSPVRHIDYHTDIKSIGNSSTPPSDIKTPYDAKIMLCMLSESVAHRLKKHGLVCKGLQLHTRTTELICAEKQKKLGFATNLASDIFKESEMLFMSCGEMQSPLRSIGVRAIDLCPESEPRQCSMFVDENKLEKLKSLEAATEKIRDRFGSSSLIRAVAMSEIYSPVKKEIMPVFRTH